MIYADFLAVRGMYVFFVGVGGLVQGFLSGYRY